MTSSLRDLQEWFLDAVTSGRTPEEGAAIASNRVLLGPVETILTAGPGLNAVERLATYHHAYRARLVECLADDYPALRHALGTQAFDALCHDYMDAHPSRSFSLNAFGRQMPAFCQVRSESWHDFGAELAELEWAIVEVIHAPVACALSEERLAGLPADRWNEVRFVPSQALRVFRFEYPVNAFYRQFREGLDVPLPERAATAVAVHRRDLTLWRSDLPIATATVLGRLVAGDSLARALEGADATPQQVSTWFARWVRDGFFADVVV